MEGIEFKGIPAELVAAIRRAEDELKKRTRQQEVIAELGQRALVSTDIEAFLDEAVALIARTLGVEYCKVLKLIPGGEELLMVAGTGWVEGLVGQARVGNTVDSQAGFTLLTDEPVIVADLASETRFSGSALLRDHQVVSGMSIIIRGPEGPYGVLGVYSTRRIDFSQEDGNFLQSAANVIASTVERKRADDRIDESRRRLQALFDHSQDAFLLANDRGDYEDVNQAAVTLTGYSRAELLRMNLGDLTPEDNLEISQKLWINFLEKGEQNGEFQLVRKDDTLIHVEYRAVANLLPGLHLSTLRDITPRKEAERRLDMQYAVTRALAENHDLQESASTILQAICEGMGWEYGALLVADEHTNILQKVCSWHDGGPGLSEFDRAHNQLAIKRGSGLAGNVWTSGKLDWVEDIQNEPEKILQPQALQAGLHTGLAFPVLNDGLVLAVLEFYTRSVKAIETAALDPFNALSSQIGNFLERMRVEQSLQGQAREQAVVAELGQSALAGLQLSNLLETAVDQVARTLDVEISLLYELDEAKDGLVLKACQGLPKSRPGQSTAATGASSQAGFTLLVDEPVIVRDIQSETRFQHSNLLREAGVVSGATVIIHGRERPFGVLGVHSIRPRNFHLDEVYFLQSVANVLAAAIERKKTEDALRLSRDQLAIILQGVADGITAQGPDGVLIFVNHAAARVLGYTSEQALLKAPLQEVMQKFKMFDESGNPFPLEILPGRLALKGTPSASAIIRYLYLDSGEERWSVVKARPVLNQEGKVEFAVNIFQDITELKRRELSQHLLAEVANLLTASFDYSQTLVAFAKLVVPHLADWCAIHIVEEDDTIQPLAVAHVNSDKAQLAIEAQQRYPPDPNEPAGVANVLRTGEAEFYQNITDEMMETAARDKDHLKLLRTLGLRSAMILPLVARGRILGTLSLIWAESGRHYTPYDLSVAEELARRASLAIDNARLYRQSQVLNSELEKRVAMRTSQLQTSNAKLLLEISERKKIEEALRKSEILLQSLFNSAPDATVLVNGQGEIVRLNPQAETLFGYQQDELLGKQVDVLLPDNLQAGHALHRANYLAEPRIRPMGAGLELFGKRKNGGVFPVDILLSPVHTPEGILVTSSIRDITERKSLETELAEVQRNLMDSREAERVHLAQELHDGPIQDLYAASFQLKGIEYGIDKPEDKEQLNETVATLQNVVRMLRATCGELRPPTLAPFGLEKAIHSHLEGFHDRHPGLEIHLDLDQDGQTLPERVRLALFRVYQHSISNVVRHAEATRLDIRFKLNEDRAILEIQDDGCGFTVPSRWIEFAREGHLGLVGTAERVEAIGGLLKITSSPGNGTLIRVTVNQPREDQVYKKGFLQMRIEG